VSGSTGQRPAAYGEVDAGLGQINGLVAGAHVEADARQRRDKGRSENSSAKTCLRPSEFDRKWETFRGIAER
jgi:xanthine/CO dehydrogenase XdhC/CoxF family maturation factor